MEDLLKVGVITSTHGIRGEVKVYPTTDDAKRFLDLKEIILDTGKEKQNLNIEHVKFFKNMVIVKFKEYDNINDVERFRQCELYVTREQAVPLGENEYFIADLIGLRTVTEEGETLGSLIDVLQTGANDVYVIQTEDKEEILVPAIKECVKNVDLETETITIHLLDGLRDINKK